MLTIALSKGRILKEILPLLEKVGIQAAEDPFESRKLILPTNQDDVQLLIVRATDVPTFVQFGSADIGIVGKDTLIEHGGDGLAELLDLGIAACRLAVAAPAGFEYQPSARLRVATKYTRSAENYYAGLGQQIDLVKLYGSMEIAPLTGLADVIVDLVDTGSTLKANNLVEGDKVCDISSRLIANSASLRTKYAQIAAISDQLEPIVSAA
ncbi:MAG: ATP phosphoribosyltransferase [Arenicella sp.]